MTSVPFPKRHRQRLCNRFGDRLCITRIDQQGAPKIDRGTDETRQNKYPRIVRILSGDIFFRDEIHAIAQWCHQAHSRRSGSFIEVAPKTIEGVSALVA